MNKNIQFLPLVEEILSSKCEDAKALLCSQVPLGIENAAGCSSPASQLTSVKIIAIFVFIQWKKRYSVLFWISSTVSVQLQFD